MQFDITLGQRGPDLATINEVVAKVDPAAVMDTDASGRTLRVATALDGLSLLMALRSAGWPVDASQIRQVPSTCCGGCGG